MDWHGIVIETHALFFQFFFSSLNFEAKGSSIINIWVIWPTASIIKVVNSIKLTINLTVELFILFFLLLFEMLTKHFIQLIKWVRMQIKVYKSWQPNANAVPIDDQGTTMNKPTPDIATPPKIWNQRAHTPWNSSLTWSTKWLEHKPNKQRYLGHPPYSWKLGYFSLAKLPCN